MKSDLPYLMHARNLDVLVVFGSDGFGLANAPFIYFVGDTHVTSSLVIVKRTARLNLVHHPIRARRGGQDRPATHQQGGLQPAGAHLAAQRRPPGRQRRADGRIFGGRDQARISSRAP